MTFDDAKSELSAAVAALRACPTKGPTESSLRRTYIEGAELIAEGLDHAAEAFARAPALAEIEPEWAAAASEYACEVAHWAAARGGAS